MVPASFERVPVEMLALELVKDWVVVFVEQGGLVCAEVFLRKNDPIFFRLCDSSFDNSDALFAMAFQPINSNEGQFWVTIEVRPSSGVAVTDFFVRRCEAVVEIFVDVPRAQRDLRPRHGFLTSIQRRS